jgi:outer membrane protein assembly factor BamB
VSPDGDPPLRWSEKQNVRFKVALDGDGLATPVVWGDRIYVLSAASLESGPGAKPATDAAGVPLVRQRYLVAAYDRRDGSLAWQRVAVERTPHESRHLESGWATASPVTDGERLYAFFGSRGLYCLDLAGEVVWEKDLGRMQTLHAHGEGSSPVLHRDTLIVCWDHEGDSFLYALDKHTGAQRWKVARDEETSWSTPLIVEHEGGPQVVVSATRRVCGYDLRTGALLWQCAGLSRNVVSSPVAGHGMVIAGNSYDWQAMLAIRLAGARGDITDTAHLAWKLNRLTPYVSSPLLYDDTLYFLRHNQNVLSRLDPVSGEPRGEPLRLDGIRDFIFASPVGAAGRLYITARDGVTVVLRHDRDNAPLALNRLDDVFSASPALVDRELYLRGEKFLYCIAEAETW